MKKLIVGLGNPGSQYTWTRHNLGFLALEAWAVRSRAIWRQSFSGNGKQARVDVGDVSCSLLMPTTFMNHSGLAVHKCIEKTGVVLENVLIVADDLSLPFGALRLRACGGAGGHNGLKSIIHDLGSNQFARLRLGIDSPKEASSTVDYVLADFTRAEKEILPDFINHALDCVTSWVTEGVHVAMNRFNQKRTT